MTNNPQQKPEEVTSHGIALKFAEIFQNNYPRKPLVPMMKELQKDIDNLVQSRITELESRLRASNEYAERNGLPGF